MAMLKATSPAALAIFLILIALTGESLAALEVGFYGGKCGPHSVENVAFNVVKENFINDSTLVAALIRMQFHDCFVQGCDASLLLDGSNSEKTAKPNQSVRSFEVIDAVKAALENICPGVVSCADIIVLAARAVVVLAGGRWYDVETGRRDGTTSVASGANLIPAPSISVSGAIQAFAAKGMSTEDFVLLLGGHMVGVVHCNFFQDRLYDFNGVSGTSDPSLNPKIVPFLKSKCPRNDNGTSNTVSLDQSSMSSANVVDNGFYKAIVAGKGILQLDQSMASDASTKDLVSKYADDNDLFQTNFGQAMVRLGRVGVLTGSQGQIRENCRQSDPIRNVSIEM